MDMRGYQRYREDSLSTMTQGELLLLLFEAAVDRSVKIIRYLDDTLDRQYPISQNLDRLYEYFCYELSRVKNGRNQKELSRVKGMAAELRDSFRQADKSQTDR